MRTKLQIIYIRSKNAQTAAELSLASLMLRFSTKKNDRTQVAIVTTPVDSDCACVFQGGYICVHIRVNLRA